VLESLALNDRHCITPDTCEDGHALYQAVREQGLEGVVAKRSAGAYRPGPPGWIKLEPKHALTPFETLRLTRVLRGVACRGDG
jgi:ATP-dependent DNA ligase